jgi:hypothetical protein
VVFPSWPPDVVMLLTSVSDDAEYVPRERGWSGQWSYSRWPFNFPAP